MIIVKPTPQGIVINPSRRIMVSPSKKPYWEENGWSKYDNNYYGYYKLDDTHLWKGMITIIRNGRYGFYIKDPPIGLSNYHKWQCFSHKGEGIFCIHFHTAPKDIDSGIMMVERILNEALNRDQRLRKRRNQCMLKTINSQL